MIERLSRSEAAPLVMVGFALEAVFLAIGRASEPPANTVAIVTLMLGAALLQVLALALALGAAGRRGPDRDVERRGRAYATVVFFAIAFRATLVLAPPALSPDVYRYAWEGRIQLAGESPYAHAPDDATLDRLHDSIWERVEHRRIPTVYGPLSEMVFAGAALLPERARVPGLKVVFGLADLAVFLLVTRALKRRGLPAVLSLAYGWHPLAIVETAGEGHMDALPVALLLLALDGVETHRKKLAGIALGLSASPKYLTLALVPSLARRSGLRALVLALVAFLVPFLPYVRAGGIFAGLRTYVDEWQFNQTGFLLLERIFGGRVVALEPLLVASSEAQNAGIDPPRLAAAAIVASVALGLAASTSFEVATFGTIVAVILLSPVVHPWYLLWLVPFVAWRRRTGAAWLVLTLVVPVVYAARVAYDGTSETWQGNLVWPRVLWVSGFLVLLVLGPLLARAGRISGASRCPIRPL